MRVYLVSVVLAACTTSHPVIQSDNGEQPAPQGEKSGTRLKARYYVGADGSEQAVGFFDSVRKENCTFKRAADNVFRCLPEDAANFQPDLLFADSTCTQPLVAANPACHTSYVTTFVTPPPVFQCATLATRVLALGPKFTGTVYSNAIACRPFRYPSNPPTDYYTIGAEIPPTSFQSATEVVR